MTHLFDKVRCFCKVKQSANKILVAVSGGPDSVALLHVLHKLKSIVLHVAHFNHHLRGNASDGDAEYVRELAARFDLPFHLGSSTALLPTQSHLEARARKLRYRWLADTALSAGCTVVVTGHTMNDQAETVLHHLIRGTGWRGLRGIAPVRKLSSGLRLMRPLLDCTRQDVLDYLSVHSLTARHDASNDDMRFSRNRIRHQILPKLIESNSRAVFHLAAWAGMARRHYANLKKAAKLLYPGIQSHVDSRQLAMYRSMLTAPDDEVLQELLRLVWHQQHWSVEQMNNLRWREVMEVCRGTRTAVELPGRIMVRAKELVIQFIQH